MTGEVFFFSGTGNCLVVARDLATSLGGTAISIAKRVDRGPVRVEADVIGIVFPVYYSGLPQLVRRFAADLETRNEAYLFAVATYGGSVGDAVRELTEALRPGRAELSRWFGVHMPQNAFRKPWERPGRIVAAWRKRTLPRIARAIRSRASGAPTGPVLVRALLSPLGGWLRSRTREHLASLSDLSADAPFEQLVARADSGYSITSDCTVCGVCARVCPVGNIELTEEGPRWLHRCEHCLACYHWCPHGAIRTRIAQDGYYYRNPEVRRSDMETASGSTG